MLAFSMEQKVALHLSKVLLVSICLLAGAAAPLCGLALESPERFTTDAAASTPLAVSTDGSLLAFGTSSGSCVLLRESSGRLEQLAQTETVFSYPAALVFEHNSDSVLLLDRRHSLYRVSGSAAELLAQELLPDSMVFGCEMRPGPAGTLIPGYYDISLCSGKELRPVYTAQLGASDTEGGGMIVDCCWAGDDFVVAEIASIAAYNNPEGSPNDSGGQTPSLQTILLSRVNTAGEVLARSTLTEPASGNYSLAADGLAAYLVSEHAVYMLDWSLPLPQAVQEIEGFVEGSVRVSNGRVELLAPVPGWPPVAGMRDIEASEQGREDYCLVRLGPLASEGSLSTVWHSSAAHGKVICAAWDMRQDLLYLQCELAIVSVSGSRQIDSTLWPGETSRFRPVAGGRGAGYYLEEDGSIAILRARQTSNRFQYLLCQASP